MTTTLKIEGMTCQNCARHVGNALLKVPGVESVDVNLNAGQAVVKGRAGQEPEPTAMVQAIERAGYTVAGTA